MFTKILSGSVIGINGFIVDVEVDKAKGLPGQTIVGLPGTAVKESRDRIRAALKNSGLETPLGFFTVNLAPANLKKEGPIFDLPIALGMIALEFELSFKDLENALFIGELSLDGALRPVKGVLPICLSARDRGIKKIVLPKQNTGEALLVNGLEIYPIENIIELIGYFKRENQLSRANNKTKPHQNINHEIDFADVKGQLAAKRALEIAAAGFHNILMIGPPGSGKSMLAKRIKTILPPLSYEESLAITKIYSVSGRLLSNEEIIRTRPVRTPHHTTSFAGMVGGSSNPQPGEISLAHHGILFLDEFPEFNRNVLEALRQPLEDKTITVSRASSSTTFPAEFMLVASMNPCPCGNYLNEEENCICSPTQIRNYWSKLSGPLLDRIDLIVEVPCLKINELSELPAGEASRVIQNRVTKAWHQQKERNLKLNSNLKPKEMKLYCSLKKDAADLLKEAVYKFKLSGRGYDKILKVSRTIADLEGEPYIEVCHLAEALQYRFADMKRTLML